MRSNKSFNRFKYCQYILMNKINKKVVIVTGAGSGIGKGIACQFAASDYYVVLATLNKQEGEQLEKELIALGQEAYFVQTDVREEQSVKDMVCDVISRYGKIDVLINNAGVTLFKPLLEATLDDWSRVIDTDLRGVFLCSKYVADAMVKSQVKGVIINISSNHAFRTLPHTEMYAAAKGGVNAMTRSMALSLGMYGIRVNCVCPGFTDTDHYQTWLHDKEAPDTVERDVLKLHATGRISTPEDIAQLVGFLASDASANITGGEFLVDGGLTASLYHADNF